MVDEKTVEAVATALEPKCRSFTGGANQLAKAVARELAEAALQAPSLGSTGEAEGWRDIKSDPPPMDGTPVLLTAFGGQIGVCVWIREWLYHGLPATSADWWDEPTHWRPLPAPPIALLSAAGQPRPAPVTPAPTPEADAREIARLKNLVSSSETERYRACGELLSRALAAEAALAAERERCAKVAEGWAEEHAAHLTDDAPSPIGRHRAAMNDGYALAAAIRSQEQP